MARSSKEAPYVFLSCPGGGMLSVIFTGVAFILIEDLINQPLHKLVDCVDSASGGKIISDPLFLQDKSNPNKALYTAQESFNAAKKSAPLLLKRSWKPKEVQEIFDTHFGDATLGDYFGSQIVPLHNSRATNAEDVATMLYKIKRRDGSIIYNPDKDFPVSPLVQASSAMPVKFRGVAIREFEFSDCGHAHQASNGLALYHEKAQIPFSNIKALEIGPFRFHDPNARSTWGTVEGIKKLLTKTPLYTFASSAAATRALVGKENAYFLYAESNDRRFGRNHLNASDSWVRILEEAAHEFLEGPGSEKLHRMCDVMVEASAIRHSAKPDSFFGFRVPDLFNLFGNKQKNSAPPVQVAPNAPNVAPA